MSQAGVNNTNSSGAEVLFLEGNSGGAVPPDPSTGIINVIGSAGTTVAGNPGTYTLTITTSAMSITWNTITSSQTLATENGYFCISPGGALDLALPSTSNLGDTIIVSLQGATSWTITQAAMQQIIMGAYSTTAGISGYLESTAQGDTVTLVCLTANLVWVVISSLGNPIFH